MSSRQSTKRSLIVLHATVLVWGFTGILGALISVGSVHLVWYRVLIAFATLFIYFKITKTPLKISLNAFLKLFFTGAIVGAHWILFFQSIKSSTVSVGLVCLSSLTLFTAILEPIIKRTKISRLEIVIGALIIFGIYLIFKFETRYTSGIILGLLAAFLGSLFSIINSRQIQNRTATLICYYELIGAWVWISIYLLATDGFSTAMLLTKSDTIYLLILGIVCTSIAYVAGVSVMKNLSAFRVALVTNLEPVYGVLLAYFFFGKGEQMTIGFYAGALIIFSSVFLYPFIRTKLEKKKMTRTLPLG